MEKCSCQPHTRTTIKCKQKCMSLEYNGVTLLYGHQKMILLCSVCTTINPLWKMLLLRLDLSTLKSILPSIVSCMIITPNVSGHITVKPVFTVPPTVKPAPISPTVKPMYSVPPIFKPRNSLY